MLKYILSAIFKVITKIGLAAVTEKFLSKIMFDIMFWLASLTTNPLDDQRVQDLKDIYEGKTKEVGYAGNTDITNTR